MNGTISCQQVWMIPAWIAGEDPTVMTEAKVWAVAEGIIGTTKGTLKPASTASRDQFAVILYRYMA